MRHGKKIRHLGRDAGHRRAMLANMANSLIQHKRITTTVPKAKALRKYVEPLLTRAKYDNTHSRRTVFSYLQDKYATRELFGPVADRISDRPGGYTRIIRTGNRNGDNAEMCLMELVDFNENLLKDTQQSKSKSRRRRRGGKGKSSGQGKTAQQEAGSQEEASAGEEASAKEQEDTSSDDSSKQNTKSSAKEEDTSAKSASGQEQQDDASENSGNEGGSEDKSDENKQ